MRIAIGPVPRHRLNQEGRAPRNHAEQLEVERLVPSRVLSQDTFLVEQKLKLAAKSIQRELLEPGSFRQIWEHQTKVE